MKSWNKEDILGQGSYSVQHQNMNTCLHTLLCPFNVYHQHERNINHGLGLQCYVGVHSFCLIKCTALWGLLTVRGAARVGVRVSEAV